MVRVRAFASVFVVVLVIALAPGALAGPDPHGGRHGKGHGGGKPSPSPTAEPSPSVQPPPAPTPGPTTSVVASAEEQPPVLVAASTADEDPHGRATGIVKIDRRPFDDLPNNEPHVGCRFQVDLSNYPAGGLLARYTFRLWPPTGGDRLASGTVVLDDDPAGGGQDRDGEVTVDLTEEILGSGVKPHPVQGWHVKVTVRVRRSAGRDLKQKVFWVRGCALPTVSPTVLPTASPPTRTPPGPLAFTGAHVATLAGLALLGLVLGTGALRISARLRRAG